MRHGVSAWACSSLSGSSCTTAMLETGALAMIAFPGAWAAAVAGTGRLVSYLVPRDLD